MEKATILALECNIGYGAFRCNYSLKEMVCHVLQPQAASSSIITNSDDGISDDFKLYVPYGTKTIYEKTEGWNNVKNFVEFNVAGSSLLSIEDFKMIAGKAKAMLLDVVNPANATLYVPKGSKAAYEAADYWKDFKEIVEFSLGDADGNGQVEQKDVDAVAEYILNGNAEGLSLINATGSDRKALNVADIVRIINIMKNK